MSKTKVSVKIKNRLYNSQNNRCGFCGLIHPLDIHHIISEFDGGKTNYENLILLCKNCHDMANTGVVPDELLYYFKDESMGFTNPIEGDPIIVYELRVLEISKILKKGDNPSLNQIARKILSSIKRSPEERLRKIGLDLTLSIMISGTLQAGSSNIFYIAKEGHRLARDFNQKINKIYVKQFLHYEGLEYNKLENYSSAVDYFQESLKIEISPTNENDQILLNNEEFLSHVHLSASMYLKGDGANSLNYLRNIIQKYLSERPPSEIINAHNHAINKLSEHHIQNKDFTKAYDILIGYSQDNDYFNEAWPIFRAIYYKDLGRILLGLREKEKALFYFSKSFTICEEYNLSDQKNKVISMALDGGIDFRKFMK